MWRQEVCTLGATLILLHLILGDTQSLTELAELNLYLIELINDIGWLVIGIKGLACLHIAPQHSGYKIHLYNSWCQLFGGYLELISCAQACIVGNLMTQTSLQLHQIWCFMYYKCIL